MPQRSSAVSFKRKGAKQVDPLAYGDHRIDREARRGSRMYNNHWRKSRAGFLRKHPLCVVAERLEDRVASAEVVDHFYPHLGLKWLFWYRPLWVAMSKAHHDGLKQSVEAQGEAALDGLAVRLGLRPLAALEPVRIHEWRKAWSSRHDNPSFRGG